jgi:glutathione S-transferase
MDSMSKGKVPFAVHAGRVIEDSQFIIRYLENTFDVASMAKKVPAMFQSKWKPFVCYELLDDKQKVCKHFNCN